MKHRYYDPTNGKWLTRDPIGYHGGLNIYGYVGNDVENRVDPKGHSKFYGGTVVFDCSCVGHIASIAEEDGDFYWSHLPCGIPFDADGFAIDGDWWKISDGAYITVTCAESDGHSAVHVSDDTSWIKKHIPRYHGPRRLHSPLDEFDRGGHGNSGFPETGDPNGRRLYIPWSPPHRTIWDG